MSNSKMLIDASHPEETRVVVLKGNRIEDFDFESASKKQLRGNIYLAKVTRVEPSLQAAFIEYGGNRHGFLAFSEIHPDYYQIPFADRQALLEEEARAHRDEDEENRGEPREARSGNGRRNGEARESGQRGAQAGDRGAQNGDRGAQNGGRGDRDRGQRRSRRHRRTQTTSLEQRGPAGDSISEAVLDDEAIVAIDGAPSDDSILAVDADASASAADEAAVAADSDDLPPAGWPVPDDDDAVDSEAIDRAGSQAPIEPSPDTTDASPPRNAAGRSEALDTDGDALGPQDIAEAPELFLSTPVDATPDLGFAAERSGDDAMAATDDAANQGGTDPDDAGAEPAEVAGAEPIGDEGTEVEQAEARDGTDPRDEDAGTAGHEEEHVEQIGGDALSDVAPRPTRLRRHYKIQEVIKRRQILLIQVVKEERGNKGAALTTYLSLAGRYSVLMPNTAKGGGISRKITDGEDRKRLKAIAGELDVPEGMGVILRTAGASRSPIEVRRDFEYLLRMWESVRELTLKSSAPTLVYEEGSLIKRSIRDLYSKEIEEIVVSGEAGFSEARDFMRMLMPGNVKSVLQYRDPQPVFAKSGVEAQLDAMFSPQVTLKSGGYLVINQTEALVAIDVNSGRSTREHNIEDTALRTNMEAADEVARQLRLRDLAGLIVVDFIDMEEGRNNRTVERRLKDALKNDRARIQIGRISHFGLLEMSRQRIRTGVLEGSTVVCPHCAGAGTVRSTASIALHVLRLVEDALLKDASHDLLVHSRAEVALYMLNQKRAKLVELEQRFGVTITVTADPTLTGMAYHAIERGEPATPAIAPAPRQDLVRVDSIAPVFEPGSDVEEEASFSEDGEGGAEDGAEAASAGTGDGEGRRRKRRRRRRGRDGTGEFATAAALLNESDAIDAVAAGWDADAVPAGVTIVDHAAMADRDGPEPTDEEARSEPSFSEQAPLASAAEGLAADLPEPDAAAAPGNPATGLPDPATVAAEDAAVEPAGAEAPKRRRSRRTPVRAEAEAAAAEPVAAADDLPARPRRRRASRARTAEAGAEPSDAPTMATGGGELIEAPASETATQAVDLSVAPDEPVAGVPTGSDDLPAAAQARSHEGAGAVEGPEADPARPKRSGWWQRAKASFGS